MAEENTFASSVNLGTEYEQLAALQTLWVRAMEALRNTPEGEVLAVWFLAQADSAWLAAVRVASGGQITESQAQLRGTLEYAVYALHFTRQPPLQEVWLRRHDDDASRAICRESFTISSVKRTLEADSPRLANRFADLYGRTIDFGAHPNERGLTSRLNMRREEGATVSSVTQLTDRPVHYRFAFRTIAQTGAVCLGIFDLIFHTKFELASIDVEIDRFLSIL